MEAILLVGVTPRLVEFLQVIAPLRGGDARSYKTDRYAQSTTLHGILGARAAQFGYARLVKHRDHTESYRITRAGRELLENIERGKCAPEAA